MTEQTTWAEVVDGDRIIGADTRVYDIERTRHGSAVLHDAAGLFPPRSGRPAPTAPVRRLARGPASVAVATLRAGGFDVEVLT